MPASQLLVGPDRQQPAMKAWAWPLGIWGLWAIVPSFALASAERAAEPLLGLHFGPKALSYLGGAPTALGVYLAMGQAVASFVLLAFARQSIVSLPPGDLRGRSRSVLRLLTSWVCLFLAGEVVAVVAALRVGAALEVTVSFAWYLGVFGFIATLPQLGWVVLCAGLARRFWVVALGVVLGELLMAMGSSVAQAKGLQWPSPSLLRGELCSGRLEVVGPAALGTLAWCATGLLLAWMVAVRARASATPGIAKVRTAPS